MDSVTLFIDKFPGMITYVLYINNLKIKFKPVVAATGWFTTNLARCVSGTSVLCVLVFLFPLGCCNRYGRHVCFYLKFPCVPFV